MTDPLTTSKLQAKGYIQAGGGAFDTGKQTLEHAELTLGGHLQKNSTFVKAQAGIGTAISAKIEAGHEIKLGKNTGLELAGKVDILSNSRSSSFFVRTTVSKNVNLNNQEYNYNVENMYAANWHDGYGKVGTSAMLNFSGKKGNIKVGVEGGYKTNNAPDIEVNTILQDINVKEHNGSESGMYVTPRVEGEFKATKHLSFVADADLKQGNAGIRWTF